MLYVLMGTVLMGYNGLYVWGYSGLYVVGYIFYDEHTGIIMMGVMG